MEGSENRKLTILNFVTSFGDWFSYFGFMYYFYESTSNILLASSVVIIKSSTILISSILYPYLSNRIQTRELILWPQLFCALLGTVLFFVVSKNGITAPSLLIALIALQSLFKEIFSIARDTYSKFLRTTGSSHLLLQAQLQKSTYLAQFAGPLTVLLIVKFLLLEHLILIDTISFILTAILSWDLRSHPLLSEKRSLIAPMKYLFKRRDLCIVFNLRTFAFTFTTGISNFSGIGLVKSLYHAHVVNSAWTYMANGLGALVATAYLRRTNVKSLSRLPFFAAIGFMMIGIVRLIYASANNFTFVVFAYIFSGIGMGLHAIASQSLRSKLTTNKEFPEVCALENLLGEKVTVVAQVGCATLLARGLINNQGTMFFSGIMTILLGFLYLRMDSRNDQTF